MKSIKQLNYELSNILKELDENFKINEGGLSKIQQAISDPNISFAIISANRNEYSTQENKQRTKELMNDVSSYGFIKLEGGYIEQNDKTGEKIPVTERSVLVKNISKEKAIKIGKKYEQESILWKDEDGMRYINLTDGSENFFKTGERDINTNKDINKIGNYFSRRLQGKNKGNYFSLVSEDYQQHELYLAEYQYETVGGRYNASMNSEPSSCYTRIL